MEWNHWLRTFTNFIEVTEANESEKLKLLINYVVPSVYTYISECLNFKDAIGNLQNLYCKPVNEVFARHKLSTRQQQPGESVDQYLEALKILSKDCNFKATSAEENRDDCIRDAFVNGLIAPHIRQRLLENFKLPLQDAYEQARCLESAQQQALLYQPSSNLNSVLKQENSIVQDDDTKNPTIAATSGSHDLLSRHSKLELTLGGPESPLTIVSVAAANVPQASLFEHISHDCHPISVKSRRHTVTDYQFISEEIRSLLHEGVIEPSISPWRAQAFVTSSENHKKRMVIDYSNTINRFTSLDAYPIPNLEEIVNKVANYEVFSAIDLKSAYHQIPIKAEDKPFTAFEACGQLYQFTRIPFGVTNGVAAFQRVIDDIIRAENLNDTFAYLDDITVCGKTQEEHDRNLNRLMNAASKYNLTINENKCSFSMKSISLLGYTISNKTIKPDSDRLLPLKNFPLPTNASSLRRAVGMFSHFSRYVPRFSEKIKVLTTSSFPLSATAIKAFNELKQEIENASMSPINPDLPFTVETDASDTVIAATLTQEGKPVAFFSRGLSHSELKHSSVEKEAYAIVESVRKWRHYLLGRHFKLITDQKSVSFMFNSKISGKIKNDKIMRWRLELSSYSYDIVYRPGKLNVAADSLSRVCSMSDKMNRLHQYHERMCHPGETRMYHWIRSKNLPYSLDEVRRMTASCKVCSEVKPRFFKHDGKLIKATSPFERLSLDFKGPLPSSTRNRYMLTIIDEYSRFPFAYPCPDMSSSTVICKLKQLFSLFGTPSYIHSDQGSSFLSKELKEFLALNDIASSRTTAYNPQCNGQVERYNGIIWRTVELALKNYQLDVTKWELVLDEALHSIRSLLCTATNCTPHERMFGHPRRSQNGVSTPTWLMTPGKVLMRRPIRNSKYEPIVQEVTLLEGNSDYAHVRLPDGRETTVSTRNLAPCGKQAERTDFDDESTPENHTMELNSDVNLVDETQDVGVDASSLARVGSPNLGGGTRSSLDVLSVSLLIVRRPVALKASSMPEFTHKPRTVKEQDLRYGGRVQPSHLSRLTVTTSDSSSEVVDVAVDPVSFRSYGSLRYAPIFSREEEAFREGRVKEVKTPEVEGDESLALSLTADDIMDEIEEMCKSAESASPSNEVVASPPRSRVVNRDSNGIIDTVVHFQSRPIRGF
ncbi:uncharacterized protein LOC128984538 [Macrosteles quadrilineatus]|uniref:uncharacterized protein LOC128984538 n=1 Tax=Macrosteles quadrilineatus TaxID=74068 RepID=UPI0023E18FC2|nr:uncharacterized protein LOC128984538 [Macrosteles quadrilineatus]